MKNNESGQSLIEFAFFLPVTLALIYYLTQISMAVNAGVVHEQYTRTRMLHMFYNSADYPALRFTSPGWQRYWIGMDREQWGNCQPGDDSCEAREDSAYHPTIVKIGNKPVQNESPDENNFPPEKRQNVRIRIISFICMPPKYFPRAAGSSAAQGPVFITETNRGMVNEFYAGGASTHVQFCQD